jgi:hypothetical protein
VLAVAAPTAAAEDLWGVTDDQRLIRIDIDAPETLVGDPLPLSGIAAEEDIHGLATWGPVLEALSADGELVRLDPTTGRGEERFGPCSGPVTGPVAMTSYGMTLHVVAASEDVWTQTDVPCGLTADNDPTYAKGTIAYSGGSPADPHLVATAFSTGAQYAVDAGTDRLVQRTNTFGDWHDVGPLGVDVSAPVALERAAHELRMAAGGKLYTVSEGSGTATVIGPIGDGLAVRDLAAVPPPMAVLGPYEWPPIDSVGEGETDDAIIRREGDPLPAFSETWSFSESPWPGEIAKADEDFVPQTGTVSFAPGQRYAPVRIPNVDDDVVEPVAETFIMRLGTGMGEGGIPILVFDDDLRLEVPAISVPESVGVVDLPGNRDSPLRSSAAFVVAPAEGGTAAAGDDYTLPQPVTLPTSATGGSLRLPIIDDRVAEGTESIVLQRATSAPFSRMTQRFVVQVRDDDAGAPSGGPGPAPLPPAADRAAPKLRVVGQRSLRLGSRGIAIRFTCSERCTVRGTLRSGARPLGRGSATAPADRARTLRVRISGRTLRRLRRSGTTRGALLLSVTDAAGNRRAVTRRVTLRR